jgi:hypothetical protein
LVSFTRDLNAFGYQKKKDQKQDQFITVTVDLLVEKRNATSIPNEKNKNSKIK